jgi:hypothetical protein
MVWRTMLFENAARSRIGSALPVYAPTFARRFPT